ncbi:MAG: mannose-6-phosphate isomerase, partial [Lachnospiraceae bacterium]
MSILIWQDGNCSCVIEMPNWKCSNYDVPILEKAKRGFFVEWRLSDQYKKQRFERFDYVVDSNQKSHPKMISGEAFRSALRQISMQPFRMQPYFDPGVWGGQWMKEHFGLDSQKTNYAWSFDGVPEENSLNVKFGNVFMELPCIDLVFYRPHELLGEKVHARFGAEFPIRFDLLDTMGGGNLSLQVHPLTEYIQDKFGMHYTQDESYYILDAEEEAYVYLGVKEGV